jgi:hypothetical protein
VLGKVYGNLGGALRALNKYSWLSTGGEVQELIRYLLWTGTYFIGQPYANFLGEPISGRLPGNTGDRIIQVDSDFTASKTMIMLYERSQLFLNLRIQN